MMNKAIVIKLRNFVDQTHSLVISANSDEDWSMLSNLRYGLNSAIEWLDEINTMDWFPIYSTDLLGRKQIKVTCSKGSNSYNFYLSNNLRLTQALDRIIEDMKISKIIGVGEEVSLDDRVNEYCINDMYAQIDISSMYPISSFKAWSPLNANAIARLSESDCILEPRPKATKCIFHGPATIVFWDDGTKTVVKCQNEDSDVYSEEAGVALCFMKKMLGNNGNYNKVLNELVDDGIERQYQELKNASLKLYDPKRK